MSPAKPTPNRRGQKKRRARRKGWNARNFTPSNPGIASGLEFGDLRGMARSLAVDALEPRARLLHFGFGDHKDPVTLEILWPDKKKQVVKDVALGQIVTYTYGATK